MADLLSEAAKIDEATLAQIDKIQKEIAETSDLIGELQDVDVLTEQYSHDDEIYQAKIMDLKKRFSKLRRTRGDGNCFYRAFAFAYIETLMNNKTDFERFKSAVNKWHSSLLTMGYPSFTLQDFQDTFLEVLDSINSPNSSTTKLLETFCDQGYSDYAVCYLRIITSGYLQSNSEFYTSFIDSGTTIKEYCNTEVEPMYIEADHIHVSALTAALGISVGVVYMDRGKAMEVNEHVFPEGSSPQIHLLYRPGHYDILYK